MSGLDSWLIKLKDMFDYNEDLLQFIWRYKLLKPGNYNTVSGKSFSIVDYGEFNSDSGPDFFNAKIKSENVILAGNVELHVKASDWKKHKHDADKAYSNVILHAVYTNDLKNDELQNKHEIFVLKPFIDNSLLRKYQDLVHSKNKLACHRHISEIPDLKLHSWLERMLIERLEQKAEKIEQLFELSKHDYAHTFYTLFLRNLGFKVNAEPFENLARHLPLSILLKHSDNLLQLEALIFGTAGLLNKEFKEKYLQLLQNEFEFLRQKYNLIPLNEGVWKFMRMRPANFPSVRMWQLAKIIMHSPDFFSQPWKYNQMNKLRIALSHQPEGYWAHHYSPGGANQKSTGVMGVQSLEGILINTLAPFLFFYGKRNGKYEFNPIDTYEGVSFEKNIKTTVFLKCGLKLQTAGQSQALIQLYDHYCKPKKCLQCGIASHLLLKN